MVIKSESCVFIMEIPLLYLKGYKGYNIYENVNLYLIRNTTFYGKIDINCQNGHKTHGLHTIEESGVYRV